MSADPVGGVHLARLAVSPETSGQAQPTFADWVNQSVVDVNSRITEAEGNLRALAAGEAQSLHHVMLSIDEATTSFKLVVAVRNQVLDAYNQIMRMSV